MLQAARVEDEIFNMGSRMRSLGRQRIQVDNILLMREVIYLDEVHENNVEAYKSCNENADCPIVN